MEKEGEHDLDPPERNDIYTRPSVIRKVETRRKVDVTQFPSSSGITFQKGSNYTAVDKVEYDDRIGSSKLEQGESENPGFISWSYGPRSSEQEYFGTSKPAQYENGFGQEDELRRERVSCLCRQRLIKQTYRLGKLEQERGHESSAFKVEEEPTRLSCFRGRQTIKQTPSESQHVVAIKQKYEYTTADLQSSFQGGTIPQESHLGKPQHRDDESALFLQEYEDKIAYCPPLFGIETINQARLHKPYHTEDKSATFKEEDEDEIGRHLMWLGASRMVKQTSYDKDHPEDYERTELKEEGQGLMNPVRQCTSPSKYEVKTLERVSRQLQINHNLHQWKLHSKRHEEDVFGCPNENNKIRGTTCPVCHKKLKRFHYLKTHLLIHNGTKPYGCAYCSKTFNQIGNRNAHQRIHTGEKPYACDYCDKRFVFSSSKHNHMKTHRQRELADDKTTGICKDNI